MSDVEPDPLPENPLERFRELLAAARQEAPSDPTAAVLATADAAARPSARMVLIKHLDADGVHLYTSYASRKARQLTENPHAALCVYWPWIDAQVRLEGTVERLTAEESDSYFATRPRGSQIGAWASDQSAELPDRETLEERRAAIEERFAGREVPRPEFWGGYRLRPERIEFWYHRSDRLHRRDLYERDAEGWHHRLLYP